MSDLIERLRAGCPQQFVGDGSDNYEANQVAADAMMAEAADTIASLTEEVGRLKNFVGFVNLWCNRESKVSDSERLSVIKHHPVARAALQSTEQRT